MSSKAQLQGSNGRRSLSYVRTVLSKRKITLLSEYSGNKKPMRCLCNVCKSEWTGRFNNIQQGHGCPKCGLQSRATKRRLEEPHIRQFLEARGIRLLGHYVNSGAALLCRCKKCGYEWQPKYNSIQQGQGCPKCRRHAPITMADYEQMAKQHHGKIVAVAKNSRLRSQWLCLKGHSFSRSLQGMKRTGTFCNICSGKMRHTLEDYKALAARYSGRIVRMARSSLLPSNWVCKHGHKFERRFAKIKHSGNFCPICSSGLAERQCKAAAEQIFAVPFKKVRVRGMRGTGGGSLELDLYNETLGLAIEHNGLQHYKPVAFGGQTKAEAEFKFQKQLEHDRRRREYCKHHGITLVEIRELGDVTPVARIKSIIKKACDRGGVSLPSDFDSIRINVDSVGLKTQEEEMWQRVRRASRKLGFQIISKNYLGSQVLHEFICEHGHRIRKKPYQLFIGQGCNDCWRLRQATPVKLSDGRVFKSMTAAAKALGVSDVAVKYAVEHGSRCRGFRTEEVTNRNK